jgi:hypothetical protein
MITGSRRSAAATTTTELLLYNIWTLEAALES